MSGKVLWDDTDPGSSLGVDTGDRELGMQQYKGGSMQADAVFEASKKQKEAGKAWWWQCVSVVLVAVSATQVLCKLQCKFCKQLLSPSNPPDVCKSHLKQKNCTGYRKGVQEGLIQVEEQEKGQEKGQQQQQGQQQEASTSNKRRATGQLRIDDMKGQRELAKEHLALFFFKNSIPLHLINDPDLKAAFSLLGCDLPTRKAKLQPFAQNLSALAAGLLPQEDGSLPPIIERVNFWRMWAKKDFPVLAEVAVRLLCMHSTACASERNWSAWGQLYTKHRSRLALERARKLIYVRCNSKQFTEDDLEASMQLLEEDE